MKNMTHRIAALLAAVAGALTGVQAQTFDTSAFSRKMDIAFSGCGVDAQSALVDFPALVVFDPLEQTGFSYIDFTSPDGADLRFVDALGMELSYEIDTWGASSDGRSLVWVRVPAMHNGAVITAYWGSFAHAASAPIYDGANNVWANGYAGVWHLNGGVWSDSTTNANTLAPAGSVAMATGDGANGLGVSAVFKDNAYLKASDSDSLDGMQKLTLEAWVKDTKNDDQPRAIFSKRTDSNGGQCYTFFKYNEANRLLRLDIPTANPRLAFAQSSTPVNTWKHAMITFDGSLAASGSNVKCYMDGALADTKSAVSTVLAVPNTTAPLCIGAMHDTYTTSWIGNIDEARISNVARSPEWAAANHATMDAPFVFAQYGAVEPNNPALPVIVTLPATVTDLGVTFNGYLVSDGGSDAYVTAYWGLVDGEKNAAAWANTNAYDGAQTADSPLPYAIAFGGNLKYARDYYVRHYAANSVTNAWAPDTIAFTTPGIPVLGEPSASYSGTTATFNVRLEDNGASDDVTVRCMMGESPDALTTLVYEWTELDAAQDLTCDAENLVIGGVYYYAFVATGAMPDDGSNTFAISTATNSVSILGDAIWTAGAGADADWGNPANWSSLSVPGPVANAIIPAPGFPITAANNHAVGDIFFQSGSSTLDLGGAAIAVAKGVTVGNTNIAAHLALANGTIAADGETRVGYYSASSTATLGEGARLLAGSLIVGFSGISKISSNTRLTVGDGALLSVSGATLIGQRLNDYNSNNHELHVLSGGLFIANGITVGPIRANDSGGSDIATARLIIDGGVVTNTGTLHVAPYSGTAHAAHMLNGAYLHQTGTLSVGGRATGSRLVMTDSAADVIGKVDLGVYGDSAKGGNFIILTNSTLDITSNFTIGDRAPSSANKIIVHADVGRESRIDMPSGTMLLGDWSPNNALIIENGAFTALAFNTSSRAGGYNNQLRISGADAKVNLATMNLRNQAVLGFAIPRDGFNGVPLSLTGAATIVADTRIEIDAGDFIGTARLMEAASIPAIPDGAFSFTANGVRSFKVNAKSTFIEVKVSAIGSTIIIK